MITLKKALPDHRYWVEWRPEGSRDRPWRVLHQPKDGKAWVDPRLLGSYPSRDKAAFVAEAMNFRVQQMAMGVFR